MNLIAREIELKVSAIQFLLNNAITVSMYNK
jgi:hypothetical protein